MDAYKNITRIQRVFLVSQGVFQFLLAVFVTSIIWLMAWYVRWDSLLTWHVFLCTVGFSFFMSEAIAFLNPGNVFALGLGKLARTSGHASMMFLATSSIVTGVSLRIHDKSISNQDHFVSPHGILGLTAFILTMVTFLGGLVVASGRTVYKMCGIQPSLLRTVHRIIALCAYFFGILTLCYGLNNYFVLVSRQTAVGLIVILSIYAFLNLFGPVSSLLGIAKA